MENRIKKMLLVENLLRKFINIFNLSKFIYKKWYKQKNKKFSEN